MINRLIGIIKVMLNMLRDMDWEYIFSYCFLRLKHKRKEDRNRALRHSKLAFIERRFAHILRKYRGQEFKSAANNGPIWVCWLQGENSMPPIVKLCYERLKKMSPPGRKVVLLHQQNLSDYVQIPEYIIQKLNRGLISKTHFSDILRFALLAEHGGVWIDSTIYTYNPISESIFNQEYYSIREDNYEEYIGVNRCLWKCFLLGAAKNSPWFCCARDIIYEYWKDMNYFIDYLLVDYILLSIYDCCDSVRNKVSQDVEYAPYVLELEKLLNAPYDAHQMQQMSDACNWFKLSYKLTFNEYTEDKRLTYYGWLFQSMVEKGKHTT